MIRYPHVVRGRCSIDNNVIVTFNSDGDLVISTACSDNRMEAVLSVLMAEKVVEVMQEFIRNRGLNEKL